MKVGLPKRLVNVIVPVAGGPVAVTVVATGAAVVIVAVTGAVVATGAAAVIAVATGAVTAAGAKVPS